MKTRGFIQGEPHLPRLVHRLLWVALHLVAGVVGDLCHRLLEDGCSLPHRQCGVQVRLALGGEDSAAGCSDQGPWKVGGGREAFSQSLNGVRWAIRRADLPPTKPNARHAAARGGTDSMAMVANPEGPPSAVTPLSSP